MGTWDTSVEGNDTFQDIYTNFMDRYNSGGDPRQITQAIMSEFSDYFVDADDKNNALFGLSKAQWETKSLEKQTLDQVREIIMNENDLKLWRDLGATEDILKKRKVKLDKFFNTISIKKEKPKRRTKKKFKFEMKVLVKTTSPDGKKTIEIGDEYGDDKYIHTSGLLMWEDGGGSVLYLDQPNQDISARWIDHKTLEITHGKNIIFSQKDDKAFYRGDEVVIKYRET